MTGVLHPDLPHFIAFGAVYTELSRSGPDLWRSRNRGAPWQVAVALSTLGELSAFAGAISQDQFGQEIWIDSSDANLDLRFIQQLPKPPLMALSRGDEAPQFFVGQDSADLHFRPEGLPSAWLKALRWAHFGGLSLVRQPLAMRLLALAEGLKAEGKTLSYAPEFSLQMDSRYDETLERMCRLADVIQVSEAELRGLFRAQDYRLGLAQISAWNPDAVLLLQHGVAGHATLYRGREEWHAQIADHETVDPIGARESGLAGLIFSCLHHRAAPTQQHLRWAVAAEAAACGAAGFCPPSEALVATLAERVLLKSGL